jgi:phosphoserine phosphatase
MQRRSVVTVILTDNPHPILLPLKKLGFQDIIASEIEVSNGVFTDRMRILGNKLDALTQYCAQEGVELTSCAHVGDGFNDAVVFKRLPSSVAFNASEEYVAKAAGHIVRSDSLLDVYRVLETSLVDHPSA